MKHFIYLILFLFSASFLVSQEEEEIIVTASLTDQMLSDIGKPVNVITADELDSAGRTSLGESIDGLLGVTSADYGFAVGQPVIRGMSGPRVKIMKNGLVNRDVSGLGADHPIEINLNDIQQIEIVRGPSALLFTNGGIGGLVNVVDNSIARQDFDGRNINVDFEGQSVNSGSSVAFGARDNINGVNLSYSYENTDFGNFDIPDEAVIHEEHHDDEEEEEEHHDEHEEKELGYLENSDYERFSHRLGFSKVEDWGYIGASVNVLETHYGIPYHGEGHGGHGGHDEHEGEEEHDEHGHEEGPTIFANDASEFGLTFNLAGNQKFVINVADEESSVIGAESFMNPVTSDETTFGYFTTQDYGPYVLDLGLRFDRIDRSGSVTESEEHHEEEEHHDEEEHHEEEGETSYFDKSFDNISLAASLKRDLNDYFDIDFGFARVERAPSATELFMNGPHLATQRFEVGNTNLAAEESTNFEFTVNYNNEGAYSSFTMYRNSVDNYIYLMDESEEEHEEHDEISRYLFSDGNQTSIS